MSQPLPRFFNELNMRVVRLTASEKAAATARFDALVADARAAGNLSGPAAFYVHEALYMRAHFGAQASTVVADDTELESLPELL